MQANKHVYPAPVAIVTASGDPWTGLEHLGMERPNRSTRKMRKSDIVVLNIIVL